MEKDTANEREAKMPVSTSSPPRQKTWADFEHLKVNDFIDDNEFYEDEDEESERFVDPRQISLFGEDEFPEVPQQLLKLADEKIGFKSSDDFWDEFESAGYEKKVTIFLQKLEEKKLMDNEIAYEMLATIKSEAKQKNQQDRFFKLVDQLKNELPEIYEPDASFYLDWKITDAVFHSRHDDVILFLNELAPRAAEDIDIFNNIVDMLAYHGYQAPLLNAFKVAWKNVEHSRNIVPWGINEFAERAVDYAVFEYIESYQEIDPSDKQLIKTAEKFIPELLVDEFINFVELVSGKIKKEWTLVDFDPNTKSTDRKPNKKRVANNLYDLLLEFLAFLKWEQNIPYSKGRFIRYQLFDYFDRRSRRELVEQPSLLDKMLNKGKQKPKKQPIPKHPLCPDAATLDIFLGGLLDFMNPQYYKLAATIELIPAWLKFLEARQLIDRTLHNETVQSIQANLIETILDVYDHSVSDPFLRRNLERIWNV